MNPQPGSGWWVAFFRNLNLGQARSKSPRAAQLVAAFSEVDAEQVINFQTNGTVLFTGAEPHALALRARDQLTAVTGYTDLVVARPGEWLVQLAERLDPTWPGAEVTLFDGGRAPDLPPGGVHPSGLTVWESGAGHVVTSGAGPGLNAGPVFTGEAGVPVTCRGVPTMIRLGARLRTLDPLRPR